MAEKEKPIKIRDKVQKMTLDNIMTQQRPI